MDISIAGRKRPSVKHGYGGKGRVLLFRDVEHLEDDAQTMRVATVVRLRGIEALRVAGKLSQRELSAARRFEQLHEASQAGAMKAIDYESVRVDGGGGARETPFSDAVMDANRQLKAIKEHVGALRFQVLTLLAGEGLSVTETHKRLPANDHGRGQAIRERGISDVLKDALNKLDVLWTAKGAPSNGIRSEAYGQHSTMDLWQDKRSL